MVPDFWKAHDDAGTAGKQLAVWGIWLEPANGSADYEVGCNHEFNGPGSLPELPGGHTIMVRRDSGGRMFSLD